MTSSRIPGAPVEPLALGGAGSIPGLDLVLFRWGPLHLAVPASQVLGLGPNSDPAAPAIGDLLDLPAATPGGAVGRIRRLSLRGPYPGAGLRVQEPVIRAHLDANAIHPLPALVAPRLRLPLVRALACPRDLAEGAIVIILDLMASRACIDAPQQGPPAPTHPSHD